MGSKNLPGVVAERGWKRASQRKLYHKVELDALCQYMLKIRPQGNYSPANMGSEKFPGGVADRGWKGASQSKLYLNVELDALCQNVTNSAPRDLLSRKYGIKKPSRWGGRAGLEESDPK